MPRSTLFLFAAMLVALVSAADPVDDPVDAGLVEKAKVHLVLFDVLVVDRDGVTVPGLTMDDFEIIAGRRQVPAETLDVDCSTALEDPGTADQRSAPDGTAGGRRIVLALDYLHMPRLRRAEVLDAARAMVRSGTDPGDQLMVVALNGGVRIEQRFTGETGEVLDSLERMQHDITLWQPSFWHRNEQSWVRGMTTLLDVLDTVPGPKAVVLFSGMADVPLDLQFQEIAAQAASSRCSIYPVDIAGLRTSAAARSLNTGGTTLGQPTGCG